MPRFASSAAPPCFYEHRPSVALLRRAAAEAVGTFLLADAVFGATFATRDAFGGSPLVSALVAGAVAAGTLVALIFALGGASGGHFNPLITFLQWVQGDRPLPCLVAYVIAQFTGGFAGAVVCRYLYANPSPGGPIPLLNLPAAISEFLATAGLMAVIFACIRSGRVIEGPLAVGAWFIALSTVAPVSAYANPVIMMDALLFVGSGTHGFVTGIAYLALEIAAALAGYLFVAIIYPRECHAAADVPERVSAPSSASMMNSHNRSTL